MRSVHHLGKGTLPGLRDDGKVPLGGPAAAQRRGGVGPLNGHDLPTRWSRMEEAGKWGGGGLGWKVGCDDCWAFGAGKRRQLFFVVVVFFWQSHSDL